MRVWLTQSQHALEDLEPALTSLGHEVFRWPLVRTTALDPQGVRGAALALHGSRWLLFTSPTAVRAWSGAGLPLAEGPLLGAVGPGTAAALADAGAAPDVVGSGDAASLAAAFLAHPSVASPVGLPLGDRALSTLRDALEAGGHQVVTATLYRTEGLSAPAAAALPAMADAVLLASPSAVSALYGTHSGGSAGAREAGPSGSPVGDPADGSPDEPVIIAIGPTTAAAVRATGRRCLQAEEPTVAAVVACIEQVSEGAAGARKRVR